MSASGIRAGQAYVEIGATDTELDRVLKRDIAKLQNFAASVARTGAQLITMGAVLSAPFGVAISKASQFEQTVEKFEQIFGDLADGNKDWADSLSRQLGRGRQQIYSFLADAQALLLPIGFQPGEAEEMSRTLTQLAVDVASFNNKLDADVMRDFRAGLTGESETLKKYGIIANETAVKQELLNKGLDPNKVDELTKVWARFNLIVRGTVAAHGDTLRTMHTFENQTKALYGALENLQITVGTKLLPIVTPLVDQLTSVVQVSTEWVDNNQDLLQQLASLGPTLAAIGAGFVATAVAARIAAEVLNVVRVATTGFAKAQALVLALQGPKGWLQLAAGIGVTYVAMQGIEKITQGIETASEAVRGKLAKVTEESNRLKEAARPTGRGGNVGAELGAMFAQSLTPAMKLRQELEQLRSARERLSKDGRLDDMFNRLADSAINAASGIQDAMQKAREEIAVFSGQMTESEVELRKMAENGAPRELIEQYRKLQEVRDQARAGKDARDKAAEQAKQQVEDLQSSAQRVVADTRTPEEQRQQQIAELRRLRGTVDPNTGKAFIDQDTFERALRKINDDSKPDAKQIRQRVEQAATGNDLRSEAGARDLLALFNNGQGKAADVTAKEAVKHTILLKKIRDGVNQPGAQTASLS